MGEITFNLDIDKEELESKFREIEELQNQVEKILNMNPLIRWFYIKRAWRLHEQAERKMIELFYPTLKRMKKEVEQ